MHYEVIIIGAGLPGLVCAWHLQQAGWQVAVVDSRSAPASSHRRVSAIAPGTAQRLAAIWPNVLASPYTVMQVWDANSVGQVQFTAASQGVPALGWIVANAELERVLIDALPDVHWYRGRRCQHYAPQQVTLDNGVTLTAQLVIAADGADSMLRQQADIPTHHYDYQQEAVVTTVCTEQPHAMTAWQRFLPSGPLAFLPLSDSHRCAIVWSTTPQQASELIAMSESAFCAALTAAFDARLGRVQAAECAVKFPLRAIHAQHYVRPYFALLGDSAHTFHPMAGQAVNLAIADATVLADLLCTQPVARALQRYQARRRPVAQRLFMVLDSLHHLFAANWCLPFRALGLTAVNHIPLIKDWMIDQAFLTR